ncbi:PAS domain S-box protein [Desulfopila sp. IMCC35006]|uniref:PAS domain-containing sensor histidine kinase n=1 Tax=Desulfopila sp. IMCC35006 TaxID=2569542 RepID=UPI0010ABA7C0|nr:PAS domain-containing sensor histidine kinase [Desulfopila sp. IMCC35006]TKB25254.1 PAS domain S-box protein [Desulfopila sp. IMCC35006]
MTSNLHQRCPEMMALLRHTEDSIFFKDMDGRFVLVSEAKARRSAVFWEDMIGKTDFDFLPLEEAQKCRDDEIFIMETGKSLEDKEEELTRLNGTKSWISVSKFPWKDISGEIIGVIGISRDITKRKKLENHILRMLSIATHDMRSPIVSIALTVKLLARGRFGEVSESVKQTLLDVYNRMMRLELIIKEYLTKSSVMSSGKIGRKQLLDLRQDIIDPILGEFSREIEEGDLQIDNRLGGIPGDKILVSANKNWLAIVYRNLLSNAIRYTQKGGVIAYGFEDKGKMYHFNVYNSGEIIPIEKRGAIFEMFESEGSSGIGLPVSRELVRRHGGDLWCDESPDGHPNFVFSIPKE